TTKNIHCTTGAAAHCEGVTLELISPKRKKIFWDFVGSHGCPPSQTSSILKSAQRSMVLGSVSLAETKSSGKAANDPAYRQASKPYLLSSDVANVSRMTGPTGGEDEKLTAEYRLSSASRRTHSLPRCIPGHEIWSHRHPLLRGRGDCA